MSRRLERVRIASLRVALISTGITALAFAIVSVIVVMYVSNSLTAQIDAHLKSTLNYVQQTDRFPDTPPRFEDPNGPRFGQELLGWVQQPDGQLQVTDARAPLPVSVQSITSPTTVDIQGTDFRVAGTQIQFVEDGIPVGTAYVVVGQTLDSVAQARSTIVVAELVVGGVLLVLVFFGAIAVGRRVGAPIELARQRQMEFTADASHELRTPLAVIEAQTSLALAQDRSPDWYRNAFQRIRAESHRIRQLVEDLLWLARVDTAPEAQPEPVDVGVLARQAVDRFASVAEARNLALDVQVNSEPYIISGSSTWLDRLLGVLLDNACKYTPAGGHVVVQVAAEGGRVRLAVEDSGPGIPVEQRGRVFDRFHRASDLPGGAGLGLAIADAIVKRTHGRWEVSHSAELGGTRMSISWPRVMAGKEQPRPLPEPPPLPAG